MTGAHCLLLASLLLEPLAAPTAEEIPNRGFEEIHEGRPAGWGPLWTRERGAGTVRIDTEVVHSGRRSIRIDHAGTKDWSFAPDSPFEVRPGDLFVLEAWVAVEGIGSVSLGVVTYGDGDRVLDWVFAARTARGPSPWRRLRSRFVVPRGVVKILPRLIGEGPATVRADDVSLTAEGNVEHRRAKIASEDLRLENEALSLRVDPTSGAFEVTDRRTGRSWRQEPLSTGGFLLGARKRGERAIELEWIETSSATEARVEVRLEGDLPEVVVTLSGSGELRAPLRFPHPFASEVGTRLVVPLNEGISYPVEDRSIRPMRLIAYGGHGICMAFWGVTDGERGHMAIIETPDDAAISLLRHAGKLCVAPEWEPQKGRFGYPRRLRYVFLDKGGHVAIAKRYRRHARRAGLFKTLRQKERENPNVDRLVGAVNVWCWERDALAMVKELREAGIDRILWSHRQPPRVIEAMNAMEGVLTSRYDIYQDLMDPEIVATKLRGLHPDWTQEGWPNDVMIDARGQRQEGWRVRGRDGEMYPCAVLCDTSAPGYARRRVAAELKTHPYRCRFIDTTTASPFRECYDPRHPMTRTESRRAKMELLRVISEGMHLVTGSETGHEAAVPYAHYFEGMLSLGPYRVPEAGRRMMEEVTDIPERVAKFQLGHAYRLPLWELVYHDCVVAQWYWGDYSNKLPALWKKRDLFNVLYGTPPMFMFDRARWRRYRERFVRSYRSTAPVARATAYSEMTDHRFFTPDRRVQQTRFAGGVTVTVNFGPRPYRLGDGRTVGAGDFLVDGLER